jgi:ribonuclease E
MPLSNSVIVSSKIYDKNERSYLHALAVLLKPPTMGLLIRSSASGINEETIIEDLCFLKYQWYFIQKLALASSSPVLLYKDEDLVKKIIRDFYCVDTQAIAADSLESLSQVRYYLNQWRCISFNSNLKLQLFNQTESILEKFHVNSAITSALSPRVELSAGGYLFIESYEAFTVVDVNSGSFNQANNSAENVLRSNCYAATEIAHQLRVRNINGVIIVDFIDMESHKDQLQLLEHFARVLSIDSSKPQIIQLSKLGLVELTRRRREKSLLELFHGRHEEDYVQLVNSSRLGSVSRQPMQCCDLTNKNINMLFFNTFFYNAIYVAKNLSYCKYQLEVVDLQKIDIFHSFQLLIVPLALYSQVVNCSIHSN